MAVKVLQVPPIHAPGELVAKMLANAHYTVESDAVNFNDTSPVTIFTLPASGVPGGILVFDVLCEIVTAFTGGVPAIDVGVSGATARHLPAADITEGTVGFYGNAVLRPWKYTADTNIIVTLSASLTAGVARFWITYRCYTSLSHVNL